MPGPEWVQEKKKRQVFASVPFCAGAASSMQQQSIFLWSNTLENTNIRWWCDLIFFFIFYFFSFTTLPSSIILSHVLQRKHTDGPALTPKTTSNLTHYQPPSWSSPILNHSSWIFVMHDTRAWYSSPALLVFNPILSPASVLAWRATDKSKTPFWK